MHNTQATNLPMQSVHLLCVCIDALAVWEPVVLLTVLEEPDGLVFCTLLIWLHHCSAAARSQVGWHIFVTCDCCLLSLQCISQASLKYSLCCPAIRAEHALNQTSSELAGHVWFNTRSAEDRTVCNSHPLHSSKCTAAGAADNKGNFTVHRFIVFSVGNVLYDSRSDLG